MTKQQQYCSNINNTDATNTTTTRTRTNNNNNNDDNRVKQPSLCPTIKNKMRGKNTNNDNGNTNINTTNNRVLGARLVASVSRLLSSAPHLLFMLLYRQGIRSS